MAKKKSTRNIIQGLVIFKHKEKHRKNKTDDYLVEKVQKKDKITITHSLSTQGIQYRYSILLNNNNSRSITNINIKILYPECLNYVGAYPLELISSIEDYNHKENAIYFNFKRLNGKNSTQFNLHFTPSAQLCNGEFKTFLKYINNEGEEQEVKSRSIIFQTKELKITPKIISHSRIREISHIPGMKRALISLGIGTKKKLNLKKIFDIFEKIIISYNFQLITKDKEKRIIWFFGSESISNTNLLGFCKIGLNVIEIMVYSINPIILGQFLFILNKNIKEQLIKDKIVKSNMKFLELNCINCGDNLPYLPKRDEPIECLKCSFEQVIW